MGINYKEIESNSVGNKIDYIFEDYSFKAKGLESTVVKIENENLSVLRQGAILLSLWMFHFCKLVVKMFNV